ncbi:putative RNA methyltransferase [Ornithinibacillus gellani]|uniref:putative RNA methyltransferase n=1 Tax=Ornithinibacillus gellani TaxID=2293253 RepID=UPI00168134F3|nr:methyltransferase domain-containing protein [Ornithinibacillus gellani]
MKERKQQVRARFAKRFEHKLQCPLCKQAVEVMDLRHLVCVNGHTFDFAKQGYIHLMTAAHHTKYNKDLFESRRNLMGRTAFFDQVCENIVQVIADGRFTSPITILDAGCGEGSHLQHIGQLLREDKQLDVACFGMDIAKEGILSAAKQEGDAFWAVADLANVPFQSDALDVVLNILSPSNYREFNRLLKQDGLLLKVVPQHGYLREIRELVYQGSDKQTYSNDQTIARFDENFQLIERIRLTYPIHLNKEAQAWLLEMTPLTWSLDSDSRQHIIEQDMSTITIDVEILVGRKKQGVARTSLAKPDTALQEP